MAKITHRERGQGALENLDVAAAAYAHEWMFTSEQRRRRLRHDMICHCLPFANRMANRYGGRGEPLDDLRQVARVGLINAVDRFNPERGSFTVFAVITIGGELKRHFRDKTWGLHVTRRLQDLALELQHATVLLTNRLARHPTDAELSAYLEVSQAEVRNARECAAGHSPVPFSTPAGPEGLQELGDVAGRTDDALETLTDKIAVIKLLQQLPDRIQRMMVLRFYGNLTQAQIAAEFGVSQVHVSRLLTRGLTWLRAAMLSDSPPPWRGTGNCHGLDDLVVRIERTDDTVTVAVCGAVNRDTGLQLRLRLRTAAAAAAGGRLVIDVAEMPLIDAAGVAILRDACVAATLAGATGTLTGIQHCVKPAFAAFALLTSERAEARFPVSKRPEQDGQRSN
jgi:RNA polymerase sigma-B factor